MKRMFFPILLGVLVYSCDVRKHDRIAEPVPVNANNVKDVSTIPPTTVQVIDSVHDFGTIKEGDMVEYSFRFKNTGDKPLIITNASASCGCTVPEKPEQPVMPGELGFIRVKFNSAGKPNKAHKPVTITSNARPEFPQLVLEGFVTPKE